MGNFRWDMSVPNSDYNGTNMRTLDSIISALSKRKVDDRKGAIRQPLIHIEPSKCLPDELHLFLRITDILLTTLFAAMAATDHKNKTHKNGGRTDHFELALKYAKVHVSCFKVEVKEGSRSSTGVEVQTPNRTDSLKLLNNLPEHFNELFGEDATTSTLLTKLWQVNCYF